MNYNNQKFNDLKGKGNFGIIKGISMIFYAENNGESKGKGDNGIIKGISMIFFYN